VSRIAVISDTHNRLPESVVESIRDAGEIWHLGDVCRPETLDSLVAIGRPLFVVHGNCDNPWDWRATMRLERHGKVFHLEHIPPARPPAGAQFVLHGHTHVPRDEFVLGVRYLNPGCISRPNRGAPASFAWLTIADDGDVKWEVVLI
jgi:putative phosphoesterase